MLNYILSWFQGEPVPAEIISDIKSSISSDKVVVYSKTYCPYCTLTKQLLTGLKQNYKLVELDTDSNGSTIQRGLAEITGQRTVPNVFINGKHIGGNSDLQALNKSGELAKLLSV